MRFCFFKNHINCIFKKKLTIFPPTQILEKCHKVLFENNLFMFLHKKNLVERKIFFVNLRQFVHYHKIPTIEQKVC